MRLLNVFKLLSVWLKNLPENLFLCGSSETSRNDEEFGGSFDLLIIINDKRKNSDSA